MCWLVNHGSVRFKFGVTHCKDRTRPSRRPISSKFRRKAASREATNRNVCRPLARTWAHGLGGLERDISSHKLKVIILQRVASQPQRFLHLSFVFYFAFWFLPSLAPPRFPPFPSPPRCPSTCPELFDRLEEHNQGHAKQHNPHSPYDNLQVDVSAGNRSTRKGGRSRLLLLLLLLYIIISSLERGGGAAGGGGRGRKRRTRTMEDSGIFKEEEGTDHQVSIVTDHPIFTAAAATAAAGIAPSSSSLPRGGRSR